MKLSALQKTLAEYMMEGKTLTYYWLSPDDFKELIDEIKTLQDPKDKTKKPISSDIKQFTLNGPWGPVVVKEYKLTW